MCAQDCEEEEDVAEDMFTSELSTPSANEFGGGGGEEEGVEWNGERGGGVDGHQGDREVVGLKNRSSNVKEIKSGGAA